MDIATNSSGVSTPSNITLLCKTVGGTVLLTGSCLCPEGLSSPYDAMITGNFCSIPSQYSDTANKSSSNSSESSVSGSNVSVTMSGIIQLIITFLIAMLLVCLARKSIRCCRRKDTPVPTNSCRTTDQYWFS